MEARFRHIRKINALVNYHHDKKQHYEIKGRNYDINYNYETKSQKHETLSHN